MKYDFLFSFLNKLKVLYYIWWEISTLSNILMAITIKESNIYNKKISTVNKWFHKLKIVSLKWLSLFHVVIQQRG